MTYLLERSLGTPLAVTYVISFLLKADEARNIMQENFSTSENYILFYDANQSLASSRLEIEQQLKSEVRFYSNSNDINHQLRENSIVVIYAPESSASDLPVDLKLLGHTARVLLVAQKCSAEHAFYLRRREGLFLPAPIELFQLIDALTWMNQPTFDSLTAFVRKYRLSPQETQLVRCAHERMTTEEAASVLGCRRATVSTYWNRIFRKTGVSSQRDVMVLLLHSILNGQLKPGFSASQSQALTTSTVAATASTAPKPYTPSESQTIESVKTPLPRSETPVRPAPALTQNSDTRVSSIYKPVHQYSQAPKTLESNRAKSDFWTTSLTE